DPLDAGGETYRGISRKNFPDWEGWKILDKHKFDELFPHSLDWDTKLQALVISFYRANFWHYDAIKVQAVADKIFDLAVNVGERHAISIVQTALNALLEGITLIHVDGMWGSKTLTAVNSTPNGSLLPAIKKGAIWYHNLIVKAHPEDAKFLNGWIARDNS